MSLLATLLPASLRRWLLAALGDNEEKFTRVFNTSADWIVITRLSDSKIVEANWGFEVMSGYTRAEVLGHPIKDFNVWAIPQQREILVRELMRAGHVRDYMAKMRRRDGTIRDVLVNCTMIALKGDTNSHAVWVARDITEQIVASEQFTAAFRLTPDCMTISRVEDGTYIDVNSAFERVMGMRREDIVGKTSLDLGIWHQPAQRAEVVAILKQQGKVVDYPALIQFRQGGVREVLINAALFESRGKSLMIGLLHDVTAMRAAEREIRDLNATLESRVSERTAELSEANRELTNTLDTLKITMDQLVQSEKLAALGALVAGVSHELNTPIGNSLAVASTQDEMLKRMKKQIEDGLRRSDLTKFMAEIELGTEILMRNLERAANLVGSFKQVAVDRASSKRRKFSLAGHVAEILVTIQPTLRKYKCKVETHIDETIILDSYPGALGQVFINLFDNALIHAFGPSEPGLIVVEARRVGENQVSLDIRDNGKGIPPDNLRRVFDPFFTTKMGQGGTGMGLHIVHNIVTGLLGGQITVTSNDGKAGTTFSLLLPLCTPRDDAANEADILLNGETKASAEDGKQMTS